MALIAVGEKAPSFDLVNQDGKSISLESFEGKYVLMWWYPKADTPGWTIEGNGFRDRIQNFKDKNCEILGVSFDAPADNKAFKEKFDFPFDLLTDSDKVASLGFGVQENEKGNAGRMSVLVGPNGTVVKVYGEVKPADHPEQVLADLEDV